MESFFLSFENVSLCALTAMATFTAFVGKDVELYILSFARGADLVGDEWFALHGWSCILSRDDRLSPHQEAVAQMFSKHMCETEQAVASARDTLPTRWHAQRYLEDQIECHAEQAADELLTRLGVSMPVWPGEENEEMDEMEYNAYLQAYKAACAAEEARRLVGRPWRAMWYAALVTCFGLVESIKGRGMYWWVAPSLPPYAKACEQMQDALSGATTIGDLKLLCDKVTLYEQQASSYIGPGKEANVRQRYLAHSQWLKRVLTSFATPMQLRSQLQEERQAISNATDQAERVAQLPWPPTLEYGARWYAWGNEIALLLGACAQAPLVCNKAEQLRFQSALECLQARQDSC